MYIVNDSNRGRGNIQHVMERDLSDEEIRTAYVAMTRPRKILIIAIPLGIETDLLRRRFPEWMVEQRDIPLSEYL
jgi:ATP-dependent exoDNAse (exonuclease V) beta subunit